MLAIAAEAGLLPTTVEKDYVLGWVLFAITEVSDLGRWYFKGGTCLKKCFFDTYRFSEDLDFTIPEDARYDADSIQASLLGVAEWVRNRAGIDFPADGVDVRESVNRRGHRTFTARLTFVGPLRLPRAERQRIRFDLTRDELVVVPSEAREVVHGYSDAPDPTPRIQCYSLHEVLAEKVRALLERSGRARDVYDVVNIGRNLRDELSPAEIAAIAREKFRFKDLDPPSPDVILARIDPDVFATDWRNALRHQLPALPQAADFLAGLRDILDWLFVSEPRVLELSPVPGRKGEVPVPPVRFMRRPATARAVGGPGPAVLLEWPAEAIGSDMDRVRYAARNRLLIGMTYHGVARLVEPYSLRMPSTGNLLLYVYEVQRGASIGGGLKTFKVEELGEVYLTDRAFQPRYLVEL